MNIDVFEMVDSNSDIFHYSRYIRLPCNYLNEVQSKLVCLTCVREHITNIPR